MRRQVLIDSGKLCIPVNHETYRLIRQPVMPSVYKIISTDADIFPKYILIERQGGYDLSVSDL